MTLVVFLRGTNVGGHNTFRPSVLAREMSDYDVVNVGAAGTFVVRKPGSRTKFQYELRQKLPFEAEVISCAGRDLIRLEAETGRSPDSLPITLPGDRDWFVQIIGSKNRLVFGMYRRHMKTIRYLSQIDEVFGVPATTRNWNTVLAIIRILKGYDTIGPVHGPLR